MEVPTMNRYRPVLAAVLAAAFLGPSAASAACRWQVMSPKDPSPSGGSLYDVAAVASNDVWAIGDWVVKGTGKEQLQHFDGTSWHLVLTPLLPFDPYIIKLSAAATNDVWAVGGYDAGTHGVTPMIVHWDGAAWTVVAHPAQNDNGDLYAVAATASNDVWVSGYDYTLNHALLEHYDGTQWKVFALTFPNGEDLYTIAGSSPTTVWTGGIASGEEDSALLEQWDAQSQSFVQWQNEIGAQIGSISVRGPGDVWAVGPGGISGRAHAAMSSYYRTVFAEHWNGTAWSRVGFPRHNKYSIISEVNATASTGYTWFLGGDYTTPSTAWAYRYMSKFENTRVVNVGMYETSLTGISPVPGTSDVWAVGEYKDARDRAHNLAERWTCR
jgi:hypothetical protein